MGLPGRKLRRCYGEDFPPARSNKGGFLSTKIEGPPVEVSARPMPNEENSRTPKAQCFIPHRYGVLILADSHVGETALEAGSVIGVTDPWRGSVRDWRGRGIPPSYMFRGTVPPGAVPTD